MVHQKSELKLGKKCFYLNTIIHLRNQEANIEEGKRLHGLFCAHCHGDKGNGDGKVITVGGYPATPPAYNTLKDKNQDLFFIQSLMVKSMGPHASQLNKDEMESFYVCQDYTI